MPAADLLAGTVAASLAAAMAASAAAVAAATATTEMSAVSPAVTAASAAAAAAAGTASVSAATAASAAVAVAVAATVVPAVPAATAAAVAAAFTLRAAAVAGPAWAVPSSTKRAPSFVTNSTVAGNTASGGTGGAGFHNNSGGAGQGLGGGLFNHNGTITVTSSTFSGNTAAQGGRGIFNVGYGYLGASANINNTIIGQSDTNVSDFQDARIKGGATGVGGAGNLIRTITGVTNFTDTLTGDPLLGSLQNNGGPTQTMALLAGSPAINAGSNPLVAGNTDQRGEMRIVSGTVDIGAFELQPGESFVVPTFSDLTVAYDMGSTNVVVAGHIGAGAIFPTGSTVSITVNSVTKTATVDDAGNFSTTFDTTSLGGPDSPLTVSFEFNGSDGFSDVTANPQTVTFGPLAEKTYGDADFVLGATASSGLPVNFTAIGDASVYQDAGGVWFVHIIAAGTASITTHQAGNSIFDPAPEVSRVLTIDQADAAIMVTAYTSATTTYNSHTHTAIGVATGIGAVNLSADLTLNGTTHTNAGTYNGDMWSFHDASGNYKDASGRVDDSIARADATFAITPYSVTYDGRAHTATGSAIGISKEILDGMDFSATTHTDAGTYSSDTWTFTDPTGNYKTASGTVSDFIGKATLTVSAKSASKVYGQNVSAALKGIISGLRKGDPITVSYSSLGAGKSAAPGMYAIDAVLSDMGMGKLTRDYNVTVIPGTLTVAKDATITKVSSTASTSNSGQAVTITAAVTASGPGSGTATGMVSFYDGTTLLGSRSLSGGVASISIAKLSAGTHRITARYSGDADFLESTSATLTETVLSAAQQTSLMVSQVSALVKSGVLGATTGRLLTASLGLALASLESGSDMGAILSLKFFVAQINATVLSHNLSSAQAQPLIDAANQAIKSAQASQIG